MPTNSADASATKQNAAIRTISQVDGQALATTVDGDRLCVSGPAGDSVWRLAFDTVPAMLENITQAPEPARETHLLAALETAFNLHPRCERIALPGIEPVQGSLLRSGVVLRDETGCHVLRELLWQQPRLWLPAPPAFFPQRYTISGDKRHPQRPPKPSGVVYQRHIPWLNRTLTFRGIDIERDLEHVHRWMNDPVVAYFWEQQGDLASHRDYLQAIASDARVLGLIGCFDDEPFGFFEVYWAKEDRIAPFYDACDYDRGWHVLIGEAAFRGKPFLTAWMPSISHYLFLDDSRTQRIVIEPRIDNQKMLKSLARCGYAHLKAFDFPHKRAMLGMLSRESFFSDARWIARTDDTIFP